MKRRTPLLITVSGLGLLACQSATPEPAPAVDTTPAVTASDTPLSAPMELEEGQSSAWLYLAEKYDADGDGRVTPDECDRDNFESLDYNGDGVLTEADYASSSERMEGFMKSRRAQAMLFTYFQADDDVMALEREELSWSFGEYDEDLDGKLTEDEFDLLADDKRVEMPADAGMGRMMNGDMQPWPSLVDALDEDADKLLAAAEVEGFFDERATDGVWKLQPQTRPVQAAADRGEPKSGPKVGTVAPDFLLAPPKGGDAVKLSSFKGKKPVALVFGSYT